VLAEERLDGGVHVQVQERPALGSHRRQAVLRHHLFEIGDGLFIKATEIPVDGVEAGHHPAGEVYEQGVGGQCLHSEDAQLADSSRVHQQAHLRLHRVDDHGARLEPPEAGAQLFVHAQVAEEASEAGQPTVRGQTGVWGAGADVAGVGTPDPLAATAAISALASHRISAHLLGARRGC
jgi:hypothetical protein